MLPRNTLHMALARSPTHAHSEGWLPEYRCGTAQGTADTNIKACYSTCYLIADSAV